MLVLHFQFYDKLELTRIIQNSDKCATLVGHRIRNSKQQKILSRKGHFKSSSNRELFATFNSWVTVIILEQGILNTLVHGHGWRIQLLKTINMTVYLLKDYFISQTTA
jgi:hypothetical protein